MTEAIRTLRNRFLCSWRRFLFNLLDDHGVGHPIVMFLQLVMLGIGIMFLIEAKTTGEAFNEGTCGALCLSAKAEFWAILMIVHSLLVLKGLIRPRVWQNVAIGACISALHFSVIAYSAMFTGGQFVIGAWAMVFFVPVSLTIAASAVYRGRN